MLHLFHQLVGEPLGHDREPVDVRAGVGQDGVIGQALAVVRMKVPQFPVEPVVLDLPQLVVEVRSAKVLRGYQVTPVTAIRDVEEVPILAEVLAEGHVVIKQSVNEVRPGRLVEDEGAPDEVGRGYEGDIPEALPSVLDDFHVVRAACVVF